VTAQAQAQGQARTEPGAPRRLPPVTELAVASVALMIVAGIYLAARLPTPPPLAPAIGLLATGAVLTATALVLLARIHPFAWSTFRLVARWAFLAYLVIAGMLGFVFVFDHTRGGPLGVLLAALVVFAVDVPLVIGFTVARYDRSADLVAGF
jgi:hypothetical protein